MHASWSASLNKFWSVPAFCLIFAFLRTQTYSLVCQYCHLSMFYLRCVVFHQKIFFIKSPTESNGEHPKKNVNKQTTAQYSIQSYSCLLPKVLFVVHFNQNSASTMCACCVFVLGAFFFRPYARLDEQIQSNLSESWFCTWESFTSSQHNFIQQWTRQRTTSKANSQENKWAHTTTQNIECIGEIVAGKLKLLMI